MLPEALDAARNAAEEHPRDLERQLVYASCLLHGNNFRLLRDQLTRCLALPILDAKLKTGLLLFRAIANLILRDYHGAKTDLGSVNELHGFPAAITMVFWLLTTVIDLLLADYTGAIADCSTLLEVPGLLPGLVPLALLLRAIARTQIDDPVGAREDVIEAVEKADLLSPVAMKVLVAGLSGLGERRGVEDANNIADAFLKAVQFAPTEKQATLVMKVSTISAFPNTRALWPLFVRRMHEKLPGAAAHAIGPLLPVADVLEGKGRSQLDALPPEERAFALEVLERFEPKEEKPEEAASPEDKAPP
jgi:hypothetical protein